MRKLIRCFVAERDFQPGQTTGKRAVGNNAVAHKGNSAAGRATGVLPPGSPQPTPDFVAAAKLQNVEVEAEQSNSAGNDGVVQVTAEDAVDKPGATLRASVDVVHRISFGSPVSLFVSPSIATHQSLTLKLQGVSRPTSSGPVDNWVALSSIADAHNTTDSTDRVTAGSKASSQRQLGSRPDATPFTSISLGARPSTGKVISGTFNLPLATNPTEPQSQPHSHLPQTPQHSRPLQSHKQTHPQPHPQPQSIPASIPPGTLAAEPPPASDARPSTLQSTLMDTCRTSPSRWSCGSGSTLPAQATVAGTAPSKYSGWGASCPGGVGSAAVNGPAGASPPHATPRPTRTEELASVVTALGGVRGHWLEALGSVVALTAELLGADSVSVYLLSDSGAIHAAMACQGDAGGAVRLGMPLPCVPRTGHPPTALQRLFLTGEPQRGSVWDFTTHAAPSPSPHSPTPQRLSGPQHQPDAQTHPPLPHHHHTLAQPASQSRSASHSQALPGLPWIHSTTYAAQSLSPLLQQQVQQQQQQAHPPLHRLQLHGSAPAQQQQQTPQSHTHQTLLQSQSLPHQHSSQPCPHLYEHQNLAFVASHRQLQQLRTHASHNTAHVQGTHHLHHHQQALQHNHLHHPYQHSQHQYQPPVQPAPLPPDWQAMRVMGGMTDFAAVPLLRGDVVIGALQVLDNCTPPEDNPSTLPAARRCRGTAELSVVAAFIGALLVDHEVCCLMGALEAVEAAQDVDGLVRALARHVSLFCSMRKFITPGVRVALIRGDASALALFLDEGAAAAATAAAPCSHGFGGLPGAGSTTPVGVLSAAVSRHSTTYNNATVTSTTGGCYPMASIGGGGGVCGGSVEGGVGVNLSATAPSAHLTSTSGLGSVRSHCSTRPGPISDATGRLGSMGQASSRIVPLYEPMSASASRARVPCPILDSELSAVTAVATAEEAAGAASSDPACPPPRPGTTAANSKGASVVAHTDPAATMSISTSTDMWPWFASTCGGSGGECMAAACGSGSATAAVAATPPLPGSTTLTPLATAISDESVVAAVAAAVAAATAVRVIGATSDSFVGLSGAHVGQAAGNGTPTAGLTAPASASPGALQVIAVCGTTATAAAGAVASGRAAGDQGICDPVAVVAAAAANASVSLYASAGLLSAGLVTGTWLPGACTAAPTSAAAAAPASASQSTALLSGGALPSSLLAGPSLDRGTLRPQASGGLYGKALGLAGEELCPTGGRGPGQVQGHAMLTRGTVLAEVLAAGVGMYIADVAIYMQDGRNKSRDVFLAPSSRGGPAQPTNSIAVTAICHAGMPLVGIYLTYGTALPASLLNALISKVHLFGCMLGPLLYDRLTGADSELADEWRYLLGEVLHPKSIQSAADDQRSRRSSYAPYNPAPPQPRADSSLPHHPPPQHHAAAPGPPNAAAMLATAIVSPAPQAVSPPLGTPPLHHMRGGAAGGAAACRSSSARRMATQATFQNLDLAADGAASPGLVRDDTPKLPYNLYLPTTSTAAAAGRGPSPIPAGKDAASLSKFRRSRTSDAAALVSLPPPASMPRGGVSDGAVAALLESSTSDMGVAPGSGVPVLVSPSSLGLHTHYSGIPLPGQDHQRCAKPGPYGVRPATPTPASERSSTHARVAFGTSPTLPPSDVAGLRGIAGHGHAPGCAGQGACASAGREPARGQEGVGVGVGGCAGWSLRRSRSHHQHRRPSPAVSSAVVAASQERLKGHADLAPLLDTVRSTTTTTNTTTNTAAGSGSGGSDGSGGPASDNDPPAPLTDVQRPAPTTDPTVPPLPGGALGSVFSVQTCSSSCALAPVEPLRRGPIGLVLGIGRDGATGGRSGGAAGLNALGAVAGVLPLLSSAPDGREGGRSAAEVEAEAEDASVAAVGGKGGGVEEGGAQEFPLCTAARPHVTGGAESGWGAGSGGGGGGGGSDGSEGCGGGGGGGGAHGGGAHGDGARIDGSLEPSPTSAVGGAPVRRLQPVCMSPGVVHTPRPLPLPAPLLLVPASQSGAADVPTSPPLLLAAASMDVPISSPRIYSLSPRGALASPSPRSPSPAPAPAPAPQPHPQPHPHPHHRYHHQHHHHHHATSGLGSAPIVGAHCSPHLPAPPAGAAITPTAARHLQRSISLASASAAGSRSISQLELLPHAHAHMRHTPLGGGVGSARVSSSSRTGARGGGEVSDCGAGGGGDSSQIVDLELSMQAWQPTADRFCSDLPALGERYGPTHTTGATNGFQSLASGSHSPDPWYSRPPAAAAAGPYRPYPASPSPLSPGRSVAFAADARGSHHVHHANCNGGGSGTGLGGRRRSAGSGAPASPQPGRPGVGMSRFTAVTAGGGVGMGGLGFPATGGGPSPVSQAKASMSPSGLTGGGGGGLTGLTTSLAPPGVQRLLASVRRNTSFNITADPGVQDTGKVAPVMANLLDKLRSLQAEQVLARLHGKGASDADELSGLTILEPLGSGGFGTVFRGVFNGIEVAVKVLCERGAGGRSEAATMREAFELSVMTTISHPHIVQVLSAFTDVILSTQPEPLGGPHRTVVLPRSPATEELGEPTVVIAMEYCDAGSLADAVAAGRFRQPVPWGYGATQPWMSTIYATLLEIALALRHMHAMLLVHCDLKPANILLKSNMRDPRGFSAKLSDFGLVKMVVEDGSGSGGSVIGRDARTGTVTHMAPELIRATEATKMDASVDVYAFGVLMWELLSTAPVYLGLRSEEIRQGVVAGNLRPEFPPWSEEKYRALAEACLSTDPRARPSAAELVARLRALLAESGALQDTIRRRPGNTAAFLRGPLGGGGRPLTPPGFPGTNTAAAAGALLGIGPSEFSRPSRLMMPHAPQHYNHHLQPNPQIPHPHPAQGQARGNAPGQQSGLSNQDYYHKHNHHVHRPDQQQQQQQQQTSAWQPLPGATLILQGEQGAPTGRNTRSRSCSGGHNSSAFPLHIL